MKKALITVLIAAVIIGGWALAAANEKDIYEDCVRIHIRANSNSEEDQAVKMKVVEEVVKYLTPLLAECVTASDAEKVIKSNLENVRLTCEAKLCELGLSYGAAARLSTENFPARQYMNYVFPSGRYNALIIELGEGTGDNWWCVAYPPLCFVPTDSGAENFKYKSKIMEIIDKYFGSKNEQNT